MTSARVPAGARSPGGADSTVAGRTSVPSYDATHIARPFVLVPGTAGDLGAVASLRTSDEIASISTAPRRGLESTSDINSSLGTVERAEAQARSLGKMHRPETRVEGEVDVVVDDSEGEHDSEPFDWRSCKCEPSPIIRLSKSAARTDLVIEHSSALHRPGTSTSVPSAKARTAEQKSGRSADQLKSGKNLTDHEPVASASDQADYSSPARPRSKATRKLKKCGGSGVKADFAVVLPRTLGASKQHRSTSSASKVGRRSGSPNLRASEAQSNASDSTADEADLLGSKGQRLTRSSSKRGMRSNKRRLDVQGSPLTEKKKGKSTARCDEDARDLNPNRRDLRTKQRSGRDDGEEQRKRGKIPSRVLGDEDLDDACRDARSSDECDEPSSDRGSSDKNRKGGSVAHDTKAKSAREPQGARRSSSSSTRNSSGASSLHADTSRVDRGVTTSSARTRGESAGSGKSSAPCRLKSDHEGSDGESDAASDEAEDARAKSTTSSRRDGTSTSDVAKENKRPQSGLSGPGGVLSTQTTSPVELAIVTSPSRRSAKGPGSNKPAKKPRGLAAILQRKGLAGARMPGLSKGVRIPRLHANLKPPPPPKAALPKAKERKKKAGDESYSDEEKPWYETKNFEEWDDEDHFRWRKIVERRDRGLGSDD